ncbi:MAG: MFS transporter, partial [Microvirga sp.]
MSIAPALAEPVAKAVAPGIVETDIPARLDRLPWGRFHNLVIVALGITWILDGLEVTLAGSLAGALKESPTLRFTNTDIGLASSAYLLGAVLGALFFGWLTDRLGRKKLFFITLALYLVATAATAFSWNIWSYCLFRFLTGAGIGGEYTAINSTIQELIPARVRGWTDLIINGSFWIGAAIGAAGSVVLLDPVHFAPDTGWRIAFFIGAALGLVILLMRMWIPESPRWLMTHGRATEAEAIVEGIEDSFRAQGHAIARETLPRCRLQARSHTPLKEVFHTLFHVHRRRAYVGLSLMAAQAFFYNAIFFTYALVLTRFYAVEDSRVGLYIVPFAIGNFLGPVLLGRRFDRWGRRIMIPATYAASGVLLLVTGVLFLQGHLDAVTQTLCWSAVFFVASAAASSAYLTVSELFPVELRGMAIAVFYAFGTLVGAFAPTLFGAIVDTGEPARLFAGYALAALLMIGAAVVARRF